MTKKAEIINLQDVEVLGVTSTRVRRKLPNATTKEHRRHYKRLLNTLNYHLLQVPENFKDVMRR